MSHYSAKTSYIEDLSLIESNGVPGAIMAIGAHPDDVEIGAGGFLARASASGRRIFLVDLTAGEMGSNGNADLRIQESLKSAEVLGAFLRVNLRMKDRGLLCDNPSVRSLVQVIRALRPDRILIPDREDRHPDHRRASELCREALFNAGLVRYDAPGAPWRPRYVLEYFINESKEQDRFVDISDYVAVKQAALEAYASQFQGGTAQVDTRLNRGFLDKIRIRDRYWGDHCGVEAAETFKMGSLAELEI